MTNANSPAASSRWLFLFAAWTLALAATLGSLFIGEVIGQPPCSLCWYQRIFMFPLALVLAGAAFRSDSEIWVYAAPLAVLGFGIAAYHSLLFADVIPTAIEPCGAGPSCTGTGQTILGYVPMPYVSAATFAAIVVLLLLARDRRPQ